jgi:hypothetical protein
MKTGVGCSEVLQVAAEATGLRKDKVKIGRSP